MDSQLLRQIIEGAIIVSEKPLDIANIEKLFDEDDKPERRRLEQLWMTLARNVEAGVLN